MWFQSVSSEAKPVENLSQEPLYHGTIRLLVLSWGISLFKVLNVIFLLQRHFGASVIYAGSAL